MEKPNWSIQITVSSLAGLILLKAVLLGSLWAQVQPHPPARVGPFIAASLSLAVVSIPAIIVGTVFSVVLIIASIASWRTKK